MDLIYLYSPAFNASKEANDDKEGRGGKGLEVYRHRSDLSCATRSTSELFHIGDNIPDLKTLKPVYLRIDGFVGFVDFVPETLKYLVVPDSTVKVESGGDSLLKIQCRAVVCVANCPLLKEIVCDHIHCHELKSSIWKITVREDNSPFSRLNKCSSLREIDYRSSGRNRRPGSEVLDLRVWPDLRSIHVEGSPLSQVIFPEKHKIREVRLPYKWSPKDIPRDPGFNLVVDGETFGPGKVDPKKVNDLVLVTNRLTYIGKNGRLSFERQDPDVKIDLDLDCSPKDTMCCAVSKLVAVIDEVLLLVDKERQNTQEPLWHGMYYDYLG